jgi:Zn ribbon nucleic-acid-binding protein
MACTRCGGFLVSEWVSDRLNDAMEMTVPLRRCVMCGYREDEVILRNRMAAPIAVGPGH